MELFRRLTRNLSLGTFGAFTRNLYLEPQKPSEPSLGTSEPSLGTFGTFTPNLRLEPSLGPLWTLDTDGTLTSEPSFAWNLGTLTWKLWNLHLESLLGTSEPSHGTLEPSEPSLGTFTWNLGTLTWNKQDERARVLLTARPGAL